MDRADPAQLVGRKPRGRRRNWGAQREIQPARKGRARGVRGEHEAETLRGVGVGVQRPEVWHQGGGGPAGDRPGQSAGPETRVGAAPCLSEGVQALRVPSRWVRLGRLPYRSGPVGAVATPRSVVTKASAQFCPRAQKSCLQA